MNNRIDVCLSPELMHLYDLQGWTVVVVDILRATSCLVTAFAHGVDHIVPVADLEVCMAMKAHGYVISGERNGEKIPGFDKGNSPLEYIDGVRGKKIAFTTTNGTIAIEKSKGADQILIGSFLNLTAVAKHLTRDQNPVLVVCAGWKGEINLEDSLFAGALLYQVKEYFDPVGDASLATMLLYEHSQPDLTRNLSRASHVRRLQRLQCQNDIDYCFKIDLSDDVPIMREGVLKRSKN